MAAVVDAAFVIPERSQLLPLQDEQLQALPTTLNCGEEDASLLFATVLMVRSAIHHHPQVAIHALEIVEPFLVGHIPNLRSAISRIAVIAAGELAQLAADSIVRRPSIEAYVTSLLLKACGDKKFIRDPAIDALNKLAAAPNPSALLFLTLIKHSGSKNRTCVTLSAELATSVLQRLPQAESSQLDLPSVSRSLACYSCSRSSEARTCAMTMSRHLAGCRGVSLWRQSVTASVKPQDCRDLLKCISDMEDTVGAEVGLVDGADKENMCAGMVTPVRPSGKAAVCPGSSHSGVHMKDASGGLRQYLKEQSVGKAEARRISGAYMGLACASPDASLARGVVMVVGSSGALSARGGAGSSCGRPRNSLGGNGSVTPLLVLQRTSSTPAMPLRSRLSLSGNNVPGPFPLSMADEGCGEKTALAGSCTPTLSAPAGGFMDGSCSELGSARDPIILPIGEEAAALLETWPAGYRSMEVS